MLGKIIMTAAIGLSIATAAGAQPAPSDWGAPQKIDQIDGNHPDLNTSSLDGCPILSPDGRQLFMASNRPGGRGGLDIWVATRESSDEPFGAPENLPAPVNTESDDFCPTPLRGGRLLFVSRRPGGCGLGDIYITRLNPTHGWRDPQHLACAPEGPNTELDEQGPSYVEVGDGAAQLFYSSGTVGAPSTTPPTPIVQGNLFVSQKPEGGQFGPGAAIDELNSTGNDIQPNVRKDGREIVFASNRSGGQGGLDIYASTRDSVGDPWSAPWNLGTTVNTGAAESRPSLSWDARTLLFGRAPGPEGSSDIYVSTR